MKKAKLTFYLVFTVFCLVCFFFTKYANEIVNYWDWDPIDNTWIGYGKYLVKLGAVGIVLFVVGIILENVHIYTLKRKVKSLENEVLNLKGKLYDENVDHDTSTANEPTDPDAGENDEEPKEA